MGNNDRDKSGKYVNVPIDEEEANNSTLFAQVVPAIQDESSSFLKRNKKNLLLGLGTFILLLIFGAMGKDNSEINLEDQDEISFESFKQQKKEIEKMVEISGEIEEEEEEKVEEMKLENEIKSLKLKEKKKGIPDSGSSSEETDPFKINYDAPDGIEHVDNPCNRMRKVWENMPYDFKPSDRELIIGAGEGATGTSYAAAHIRKLGYNIAHWNHANADAKATKQWKHVLGQLLSLQPLKREHFNFDVIPDRIEGIFDTPVANLFPYLFKAYPKSKVVLTTRNPAQWVLSRTRRSYLQSIPSTYQRASIMEEMKDPKANVDRKRPQATMLQFETFNLMVRCIVPKDQLLEIDVIQTPNDKVIAAFNNFLPNKKKKGL